MTSITHGTGRIDYYVLTAFPAVRNEDLNGENFPKDENGPNAKLTRAAMAYNVSGWSCWRLRRLLTQLVAIHVCSPHAPS